MPRWLNFHRFSRLGLDDFDFGMAVADLFFKPFARSFIAMAQQNGAGRNSSDEIHQVFPIGVRSEIEVLDFTTPRYTTGAGAEHKRFAWFRRLQPSARRVRVRVADEENGCLLYTSPSPRD